MCAHYIFFVKLYFVIGYIKERISIHGFEIYYPHSLNCLFIRFIFHMYHIHIRNQGNIGISQRYSKFGSRPLQKANIAIKTDEFLDFQYM